MNTARERRTDEPGCPRTMTTASMGIPRPQIIATADIPTLPEAVFWFLADLENHAAIARGFVELLSVTRGAGAPHALPLQERLRHEEHVLRRLRDQLAASGRLEQAQRG